MQRFKEPSTWAGLSAVAGALLPVVGVPAVIVSPLVALLGGVAVWLREKAPV